MSEEEKEAIEYWKKDIEFYHYNTQLASEHYAQILLNLIDRLQKENEKLKRYKELKKIPVENLPEGTEMILMYKMDFDRNFGNDYVSKDKIKDKIKELKEIIDNLSDKMIKAMERKRLVEFDEYNEMCKKYSFVLEILEDLLGE